MEYHKKYTHIKPQTIEVIKNLIYKEHYFRATPEKKTQLLKEALAILSEVYGIETPRLEINAIYNIFGCGCYNVDTNTIYLSEKISLMTFLHEFKHALQCLKNARNNEEIARGWSCSVFFLSAPKIFNKSKEKGLFFYT